MMNKKPSTYYKNRLTPPKAFFEWCYSKMPTYVWKNKERMIVASDRKHEHVVKKRLTKNSRLTFFDKREIFEVVLSTSKRIERQFYEVFSSFEEGKQIFDVKLLNLHIFINDEHIKIHRERGNIYVFGLKSVVTMFNYYYAQPECYPNWKERLEKVSELRYVNLDDMTTDMIPMFYRYRDRIEYIQKIKAKKIEEEFITGRLDLRIITMNWLKKWKLYIRNSEYSYKHVCLKQAIEKRGKMIEGIEPYLLVNQVSKVPKEMSIVRFQNYLIKQKKTFNYYEDYLKLLNEIGQEVTNKRRFPKDLVKAHDEAVDTLNAMKREIVRKEFKERKNELLDWEMTIGDYSFVLPNSADEIMQEGKALKHCVGSRQYIEGHAERILTIVFVRKKEKMKESFFTLEYKNGRVVQLQGFKNQVSTTDELQLAVDSWLEKIIEFEKKKEKQVA